MIQCFLLGPKSSIATLYIRNRYQRIDGPIAGSKLITGIQSAVHNRHLKIQRAPFASRVHIPWLAVVVLCEAPLATVVSSTLLAHRASQGIKS